MSTNKKRSTSHVPPSTTPPGRKPADRAHFERSAVIAALGEADLPAGYYVRRGHIMEAYGFDSRRITKFVKSGVLVEKHFMFKN